MHDGGGLQVVAIRFPSVAIAPGSTIATANIMFDVDEVRPGQSDQKVSITIFGEASTNPAPLTAGLYDLSNRDTTSAAEMWTPAASTTTHEDLVTSDISSVLNEIVRLPGWVSTPTSVCVSFVGTGLCFHYVREGGRVAVHGDRLSPRENLHRLESQIKCKSDNVM
jgi:hypothetical protein